jgi:phosphoglycerate dehydrogenase-like enzyme
MQASPIDPKKTTTIILWNTAIAPVQLIQTALDAKSLSSYTTPVYLTPSTFTPTPIPLDSETANSVKVLAVNTGMTAQAEDLLENYPSIEWVHSFSVGVDSLITPKIKKFPIKMTNGKGNFSDYLAEFVIFQMLFFCKMGSKFLKNQKEKKWEKFFVRKLSSLTLCIYGFGEIGRCLAKMAKGGFGMKVIGVKKRVEKIEENLREFFVDEIVSSEDDPNLTRVLNESDFVVNILPLTQGTRGIFKNEVFEKMKETAIFMNIGRGETVNEEDLIESLKSGTIGGAFLDVVNEEPLDPESPLWLMENVYISPHTAYFSQELKERVTGAFMRNLRKYLKGEEFENTVDFELGY